MGSVEQEIAKAEKANYAAFAMELAVSKVARETFHASVPMVKQQEIATVQVAYSFSGATKEYYTTSEMGLGPSTAKVACHFWEQGEYHSLAV